MGIALLLVLLWLSSAAPLAAQSLVLQTPAGHHSTLTVPAAADFATTEVGDPWDFENASDYVYMFSEGWDGVPVVAEGRVSGLVPASSSPRPALQLQFEGINGALNIVGRTGIAYPIDPRQYDRLSFRMRRNVAPHVYDLLDVTWFHATARVPSAVGARHFLSHGFDDVHTRYLNQSPPSAQRGTGWHIYKLDLDTSVGNPRTSGPAWGAAGIVRGLRLGLGEGPLAPLTLRGATIEVDWVRLTRRGARVVTLAWRQLGGDVTLTASNGTDTIQIYPDAGTRATTFPDNGTYTWDYGFLPPGRWTLRAASDAGQATATLVIAPQPTIAVTEPGRAGGRDFARSTIGDPWDLVNPEDVHRDGWLHQITDAQFGPNGLTGWTTGTDPVVHLLDDSRRPPGTARTIDGSTYRHLTFTLEYDRKHLNFVDALGHDYGGVARVIWRPAGSTGPLTSTQDIFVLDGGPHTYSLDLGALRTIGTDASPDSHLEAGPRVDFWEGPIGVFRIDPFESRVARTFRLANVTLTADPQPDSRGVFTIRWRASGGAGSTVRLYHERDRNRATRTLIAGGLPAETGQHPWNAGGLPAGRYFIYAEVTDPLGVTHGSYGATPVAVGPGLDPAWLSRHGLTDPEGDPDGDGLTNQQEFMAGTHPLIPNTWHLSEGASGFFDQRIAVANPAEDPAEITITFLREGSPPVERAYTVAPYGRLTVRTREIPELASQAFSSIVTTRRGGVVVERTMMWDASRGERYGGHTGKGVQQPRTSWYFAEGEANFFDTWILLANGNDVAADVRLTYLLEDGTTVPATYRVPPRGRFTVHANANPALRGRSFSTVLTSTHPITAERSMYFSTQGRFWNGGHASAAIEAPATNWFVAEGRTGAFFDTYLLLANPGSRRATVSIRYLKPGGAVVTQTVQMSATSRATIHVNGVPGLEDTDVSAAITSSVPVLVERAMYWPAPFTRWYEAHNSAGLTAAGTRWVLAEGEVGGPLRFETYLLLANPAAAAATVTLRFLRAGGAPILLTRQVPGNSRLTVSAREAGLPEGEQFGVLVDSTAPVVVERAMYWNGGGEFWGGGTNETGTRLR